MTRYFYYAVSGGGLISILNYHIPKPVLSVPQAPNDGEPLPPSNPKIPAETESQNGPEIPGSLDGPEILKEPNLLDEPTKASNGLEPENVEGDNVAVE